jgi:hypothetical protein
MTTNIKMLFKHFQLMYMYSRHETRRPNDHQRSLLAVRGSVTGALPRVGPQQALRHKCLIRQES